MLGLISMVQGFGVRVIDAGNSAWTTIVNTPVLRVLDRIDSFGPDLSFAVPRVLVALLVVYLVSIALVPPNSLSLIWGILLFVTCGLVSLTKEIAIELGRMFSDDHTTARSSHDPVEILNVGLLGIVGLGLMSTGVLLGSLESMIRLPFWFVGHGVYYAILFVVLVLFVGGIISWIMSVQLEDAMLAIGGIVTLWAAYRLLFAADLTALDRMGVSQSELWVAFFTVGPLQAGRLINIVLGVVLSIIMLIPFLVMVLWFSTIVRRGFYEHKYDTRPLMWELGVIGPVLGLVWAVTYQDEMLYGQSIGAVYDMLFIAVFFVWPSILLILYGGWVRYRHVSDVGFWE